jgi:hypothetical protein
MLVRRPALAWPALDILAEHARPAQADTERIARKP